MGGDLIVYLSKGPVKFSGNQVKKARLHAEAVIAFATKICKVLDKHNKSLSGQAVPKLTEEEDNFLDTCLQYPLLSGFIDQEQYGSIFECDAQMEAMSSAVGKDEVEKFVAWWEHRTMARDTSSRPDPDDETQQLIVCGDFSYGDKPEGLGYSIMERAGWFGIPEKLGVR